MSKNEIWTAEMAEEFPYREKMRLNGFPWNAMKLTIANHWHCSCGFQMLCAGNIRIALYSGVHATTESSGSTMDSD